MGSSNEWTRQWAFNRADGCRGSVFKRSKGDLVGSAETAKYFLKQPDVPPQFLTEEVAPAIRRVNPELTRELVLKAKESLPEDSPVLLLVAQQASKLGLSHVAHEVFGKLPSWAQKGVKGIEAVSVARMGEMLRQQAESWTGAIQQYRRGLIPVHALSLHFKLSLSRWFLEGPRVNIDDSQPLRGLPLLTRHAALAGEQPVQLESSQELFLDVTTILLLYSLELLEEVESAFPKIAVPARLAAWLQADVDNLQPQQPELLSAQQRAMLLVDSGMIRVWSLRHKLPAVRKRIILCSSKTKLRKDRAPPEFVRINPPTPELSCPGKGKGRAPHRVSPCSPRN